MYREYVMPTNFPSTHYSNNTSYYRNDDRFIGGFAFPFLLGGVTGAAIAPAFWRPAYQPYPRPYPPGPYPYYRPF